MRTLIAIDTGAKGGVAALLPDGTREVYDMPPCAVGLLNLLRLLRDRGAGDGVVKVAVETITGGHGQGSKATVFKQGVNVGVVRAVCEVFDVESAKAVYIEEVRAEVWQKAITRYKAKDIGSYARWKSFLATLAKDRWGARVTCFDNLGRLKKSLTKEACDAVLILEYMERRYA